MNAKPIPIPPAVDTAELRAALERVFIAGAGPLRRIANLERAASPYATSFPLEEILVTFADGTQVALMFKNLDPRTLSAEARRAKPAQFDEPLREITVYERLLRGRDLGTAKCYGSVVEPAQGRYFLILEKVAGRELFQVGEIDLWKAAARWLARLHGTFAAPRAIDPKAVGHLLRFTAAYYEQWLERAISLAAAAGAARAGDLAVLNSVAAFYPEVARALAALPETLIHGEFYASNVLIAEEPHGIRVCAVDWERAAIGPGLIDVAALTAGNWSATAKTELVLAYFTAFPPHENPFPTPDELMRAWHLCRLHLAVQWLGWSNEWSPPAAHRQDWLAEALCAAHALGYLSEV